MQPVPRGWCEETALPVIEGMATWDALDDAEAVLRGYVSLIESLGGDMLEFEKALRLVEKRRGDLAGPDVKPGPQNLSMHEKIMADTSATTLSRWRKLARHWKKLWPVVRDATDPRDVTQAALLRRVQQWERRGTDGEFESCTVRDLNVLVSRGLKFGTVYADPPWPYGNQATRASTSNHYKTHDGLTVADIGALPVSKLAAENAHLHLWTTNGFLREAFTIMQNWGFEYRSCFVWCKEQLGIGNYWRVSHEFLLLGIRGSAPFHQKNLKSWEVLPRGKHSVKPEQVREHIEKAGDGPRLELFGRRAAKGWVVWGDEIRRGLFEQNIEEWVA